MSKERPDWSEDTGRVLMNSLKPDAHFIAVPIGYQREDILEGGWMMPDPHIAVLRGVDVTCTLCSREGVETVLELDTAGCEYQVMFLCADCVRACLQKMEAK